MSAYLSVDNVSAGYGLAPVLHDVSLHVEKGEVVAVLGANGAGKTTLLRTIHGLIAPTGGHVSFEGKAIGGMPAHHIVSRGLAMVPEGGRLFPFMTVRADPFFKASTHFIAAYRTVMLRHDDGEVSVRLLKKRFSQGNSLMSNPFAAPEAFPGFDPNRSGEFRRIYARPIERLTDAKAMLGDQYWLFVGICLVGILIGSIVPMGIMMGPMMCGMYLCFRYRMNGIQVRFETLFKGFDVFVNSLLAMLILLACSLAIMLPLHGCKLVYDY